MKNTNTLLAALGLLLSHCLWAKSGCSAGHIPVPAAAEITSLPANDGIYITFTREYSYPAFSRSPQLLLNEVFENGQKVMNRIDIYSRVKSRRAFSYQAGDSLEISRILDNPNYFQIDFGPFATSTPLPKLKVRDRVVNARNNIAVDDYSIEAMTYPKTVGEFEQYSRDTFIFCMLP